MKAKADTWGAQLDPASESLMERVRAARLKELERVRIAAQALVAQIEMGQFRDQVGHDLRRNVHFVALRDLLSQDPAPPAPSGAAKPRG